MVTRREALMRLGALVGGGLLAPAMVRGNETTGSVQAIPPAQSSEPITIAHITDTHITDEFSSEKWVAECLQKIQNHPAKPKMVIHTGDIIMDSGNTPRPRVDEYWKIWHSTVKNELSLPMHYAIGNHDIWGIRYAAAEADKLKSEDPLFGKRLAQEQLGLPKLYSSVDAGSWQIILLDSITPFSGVEEDGRYDWISKLDEEQFQWLEKELAAIPSSKPVLIGSHIPILQMTSLLGQRPSEEGTYVLGPKNMMVDARRIVDLFTKHPNVKLGLSGHMHNQSVVKLNDVTYFNAGSVCGGQWRIMKMDPKRPGFTIVKLHPDGRFEYDYENYGWQPTSAAEAA